MPPGVANVQERGCPRASRPLKSAAPAAECRSARLSSPHRTADSVTSSLGQCRATAWRGVRAGTRRSPCDSASPRTTHVATAFHARHHEEPSR
ncbi:hypothetical protein SAMN05660976_06469 [Nonomuraea pusilla]|uniref:Uncharacterized protein n=1 Tax=Nonomuraea pusilla TaxID=46177 RepID=A0A1H8CLM5_9ACTN|nr:hypothetical protein SAMN05660976_06469 [Nonomuraea pusilla]